MGRENDIADDKEADDASEDVLVVVRAPCDRARSA